MLTLLIYEAILTVLHAGLDNNVDRDLCMALSLAEQVGDAPILVLLGALHTLKRVNWNNRTGRPSVAEILTARGFSVKSFPQRWIPNNCAGNELRTVVFVSGKSHKSATSVVDGFVVWECVRRSKH